MSDSRTQEGESELFIEYALRMTKSRIRFVALASAVLVMLAVAAAFFFFIVLADHVLAGGLPSGARSVLRWLFILLEGALLATAVVVPLVRRINDLYVARLIEKAHPAFRNDLTAALQLDQHQGVMRAPLEAIRRRAAAEVSEADVESSVTMRRVKLSGIIFGSAAGVFLLYCLVAPKSVWPSIQRAMGSDDVAAPTRTEILAVEPASGTTVVSGRAVAFTARIRKPDGAARLVLHGAHASPSRP